MLASTRIGCTRLQGRSLWPKRLYFPSKSWPTLTHLLPWEEKGYFLPFWVVPFREDSYIRVSDYFQLEYFSFEKRDNTS